MSSPENQPGARHVVLPRPLVRSAQAWSPLRALLVTDVGHYPRPRGHERRRPAPLDQMIVLICVRGSGWVRLDRERQEIRPGQIAVIPPRTPHEYGGSPTDPWTLWWFHADGDAVPGLLDALGITRSAPVLVPSDQGATALLAAEILEVMERDTSPTQLLRASGAAWHLLTGLASARTPREDPEDLVEQVARALREDVSRRISVAELASTVGLSASHFATLFRRRMGVPVHRYQVELRMARARELLDGSSLGIADIARDIGYDDPFYFTRQFRAIHGTSPSEYRRQPKG